MAKDKTKGIPFQKRKENFCCSLYDIEKFLNNLSKSLKCVSIVKKLK